MRVDLHNHTTLCNHATGTTEEYILRAIELGIDVYGFSEHAAMEYDKEYRIDLAQMPKYENDVKYLKDKYKDKIEILLGYEVDYLDGYILDEVINANVDYLIGSVHFLKDSKSFWGFDNPEFIGKYKDKDINLIWSEYFSAIQFLAKSRKFDIVGHLDLMKVFNFMPTKEIKILAKDAIKEIKRSNMVVEINSAGFRKPVKEQYPSKELLELIYEENIDITFSSDAHSVEQVGLNYDKSKSLAKLVGFDKCVIFRGREKELVTF